MVWDYGGMIDTVVGGLITIKVLETGAKMLDSAGSRQRSSQKKKSSNKFHNFGDILF